METKYQVEMRLPTIEEYRVLCTSVGWEPYINFEAAKTALPNSLYGVVVTQDNQAVGMGRIVGDGAIFFYIQDIALRPDHQGKGVGRMIMETLMGYIERNAPEKAFVGLFAAPQKSAFYERFGFRAASHEAPGMSYVVPSAMLTKTSLEGER